MNISELVLALNKGQRPNSVGRFTLEMHTSTRSVLREAGHESRTGTGFGTVEHEPDGTITHIYIAEDAHVGQLRRVKAAVRDTGLEVR